MHNNYYYLRQLTKSLETTLRGTVISECFSQNKDELIIRFETHTRPFFIRASLLASFSCLTFPESFQRARKNSIDLFPKLIGLHVNGIRQFKNERSFALTLTDNFSLLFKMHGNRSNVILFEQTPESVSDQPRDQVIELFKNNIPTDTDLHPETLDRAIDWRYEAFTENQNHLQKLYFTFGKVVWSYLEELSFNVKSLDERWTILQQLLNVLNEPRSYYITEIKNSLHLSLLPVGEIHKTVSEPVSAINLFFQEYTYDFAFTKEKATALSLLNHKLKSSFQYYEKIFGKLSEIERDTNYKTWADIIMANLHTINTGMHQVTLPNFYNNMQPVDIPLKKDLSPQKNAEVYYRKAKNQHLEISRLRQAMDEKRIEIESLKSNAGKLEAAPDLKSLRKAINDAGLALQKSKQGSETVPYHEFEHKGFKIWVGKNAQSNDVLTFKYGYKEDLWLHAKDVAGSHVLIKYQSGKNFPKDVIERAAQLAAYNSKRKTDTLCPVVVTPRKFVRKRKGDPAGAVVVQREDVTLVEPKL